MLWRVLWRLNPLLLAVMVGCASTPRSARVEVKQGKAVLQIPRAVEAPPVEVEEEAFQQTASHLAQQVRLTGTPRQMAERTFQMDPLSGNYLYLPRDKKLVPTGSGDWDGTLTQEDVQTAERYRVWCQRTHGVYGDCLGGALVAGRYLDMQGRYVWALALSKSLVLEELQKALGDMVNAQALISTALWTLGSMLLILVLNPVAPALVAALGIARCLAMAARGSGGKGPALTRTTLPPSATTRIPSVGGHGLPGSGSSSPKRGCLWGIRRTRCLYWGTMVLILRGITRSFSPLQEPN